MVHGRLLVLHRAAQGETADEVALRHNRRGGEAEGSRRQEPQGGRADLHRILRLQGRLPRAAPRPGGRVGPVRRAWRAGVRRSACRQRQRRRDIDIPRGIRACPGDAGTSLHRRQRPGAGDGDRGSAGRHREQPEQHVGAGARRRQGDVDARQQPGARTDSPGCCRASTSSADWTGRPPTPTGWTWTCSARCATRG